MPRVDINSLPATSRTWLFGISPALNETQSRDVLQQVDAFLDEWAAHGAPVTSARELVEGSFLAIPVDERRETAGCSTRRMLGLRAPCAASALACPTRSTPMTKPKPPARAASTPARASSSTAHWRALMPSIFATAH